MKNLLIIYPHWPPSNLAGVHRPRLVGNFLLEFGWRCTVLTVHPDHYEEPHDPDIERTVLPDIEVLRVGARPVGRPRLVGDIGLRGFGHLKRRALALLAERRFDFLWIPIPSFYTALLGRQLHEATGVPYGIDYIDPWVDGFARQERLFSRAWLANQLARLLEPYAVAKASLISGVSRAYYEGVLRRNFSRRPVEDVAMPYGFDPADHALRLEGLPLPWPEGTRAWVYAGAFLPKSVLFVGLMFDALARLEGRGELPGELRLYFLGTGPYQGKTIAEMARERGVGHRVVEIRERFPFLHVLNFLSASQGVMIVGSTERHYTASKTFQAVLSGQPVWAVLHRESSAVELLREAKADAYLCQYSPEEGQDELAARLERGLADFARRERPWHPALEALEPYSARASARKLAEKLDRITQKQAP